MARGFINITSNPRYLYLSSSRALLLPLPSLTVVARGDVDALAGGALAAQLRHPVERLYGEGVRGVRQHAPHLHPAAQQAVLGGPVADAVPAGQARSLGRPARRAPDGVAQVRPAAVVQRLVPLQSERGVVGLGDDAARGRGRSCGDKT